MPAPRITLIGTLQDIFGAAIEGAALVFQLCGYGSDVPRVAGTSLLAQTAPEKVEVGENGQFSKSLYGNDVITPAGTFYTVQVQNSNGDVVQTNAYRFEGSGSTDLSTAAIYDHDFVPPKPEVSGGVVEQPYAAVVEFDASLVKGPITFELTLTGNVESSTLIKVAPGQIVTFVLAQDAAGNRTFAWPGNVKNAQDIDPTADAVSIQSFIARASGYLYPLGPMTVN